jgi:hypothetical protein
VVEVRIGHRIHSVLHPLYIRIHRARDNTSSEDDDGEWIEAERLRIGDEIRRAKGDWAKVEPVTQRNDCAKVYNFEVADNHNYFVGQTSLLAHNNCLPAVKKAVNSNLPHAAKRAAERGFADGEKAAADALRELTEKISHNGFRQELLLIQQMPTEF